MAKGLSQAELVSAAKVLNGGEAPFTKAYLSRIENGARNVGSEVLDAILLALEVSDDALSRKNESNIERDTESFVARETLATFIAKDKVSTEDALALMTMVDEAGGPVEVDEWRKLYPRLTAYEKAKKTKTVRRRT